MTYSRQRRIETSDRSSTWGCRSWPTSICTAFWTRLIGRRTTMPATLQAWSGSGVRPKICDWKTILASHSLTLRRLRWSQMRCLSLNMSTMSHLGMASRAWHPLRSYWARMRSSRSLRVTSSRTSCTVRIYSMRVRTQKSRSTGCSSSRFARYSPACRMTTRMIAPSLMKTTNLFAACKSQWTWKATRRARSTRIQRAHLGSPKTTCLKASKKALSRIIYEDHNTLNSGQ